MKLRKLAALITSAAMVLTAVPAMAEVITSTDGTIADEGLGWEKPEETVTFHVYAGEGDPEEFAADEDGGKAFMDAWLLEHMNIAFDW